jgi:hypothetical protein
MAYGLKVWDSLGNVVLDTDTRVGRVIGTITTGTTNGSLTSAAFSQGSPFYTVYTVGGSSYEVQPYVQVVGTTLSWYWDTSGASYNANCIIIYGVY